VFDAGFQATLDATVNPYGDGGASEKAVQTIKSVKLNGIAKKSFYDISVP